MPTQKKTTLYRIVTDLLCLFGPEKRETKRQVNISAAGVAFIAPPDIAPYFTQGKQFDFSFELSGQSFNLLTRVVRRDSRNNKTMVALVFLNIDLERQKTINRLISGMGGYLPNDQEAKQKYLTRYAPHLLQHNKGKPKEANADLGKLEDLSKLDDLLKEFDH